MRWKCTDSYELTQKIIFQQKGPRWNIYAIEIYIVNNTYRNLRPRKKDSFCW